MYDKIKLQKIRVIDMKKVDNVKMNKNNPNKCSGGGATLVAHTLNYING